jgi:hypothetical protein
MVSPRGLLHILLKAQERGTWGEEDRERREGDVGHREPSVIAGAPIGQTRRAGAPAFDELIEAARVRASRNASMAPKVPVTIV